jgi:hypothetical protein
MGCNQGSSGINGRRASKEERVKKSAFTSQALPAKTASVMSFTGDKFPDVLALLPVLAKVNSDWNTDKNA